ncbi:hypothetical protein FLONG3_1568 [Fusarium longipes]|uniref:Amino acid transporter n=1 Tax=Fusarium longipes TaxID=694270 RepID=A0A395T6Y2_9HYPO|nr:hypothetical protein FLONG3_1568 [Fusarium longipes]
MPSDHPEDVAVHQPLLSERDGNVSSDASPETRTRGTFTRNLGAAEAFGIVVSIVIGSGVFTSPGSIDTNVPSPGIALAIWLIGGILAWTGATTFAELGTAIPGEGGVQPYLQHIYGDVWGFLAAWTWIVAVMPATLAILSIVFVESAYSAAGVINEDGRLEHKLLSILVLVVMSVANSISTKASTRLNGFFVALKFLSILVVVVAALAVVGVHVAHPSKEAGGGDWYRKSWFKYRDTYNPNGPDTDWSKLSQWEIFGHYSAALYAALWAYSGWDKAIYVSAELSQPARQLPLAINTSIPTAIICFLAANAGYYILLPWNVVSTTDSVAVTAITRLLGQGFGIVTAVLICLVVAGSLLGNSFVASRMCVAAARKDWIPSLFTIVGRVGLKPAEEETAESDEATKDGGDAPINAVILSVILASFYILFGSFRALLTLNGLGEYSFFFLTVLGAIILRYREPDLERPYKTFSINPIVFVIVSGFVVVRGAIFAPIQAMIIIAIWVLGLAFYKAHAVAIKGPQSLNKNLEASSHPDELFIQHTATGWHPYEGHWGDLTLLPSKEIWKHDPLHIPDLTARLLKNLRCRSTAKSIERSRFQNNFASLPRELLDTIIEYLRYEPIGLQPTYLLSQSFWKQIFIKTPFLWDLDMQKIHQFSDPLTESDKEWDWEYLARQVLTHPALEPRPRLDKDFTIWDYSQVGLDAPLGFTNRRRIWQILDDRDRNVFGDGDETDLSDEELDSSMAHIVTGGLKWDDLPPMTDSDWDW